ncbi:DUF4097 family beta strand repeat-containing protein [Fodinibius halophilus]|uniref:DUF4097 domain-containing protein n=1 Tax=Fodinibius halophilus TaxID=1736908 RepID=A0A6M1SWE7_9BACT|nr:DUF4097 family beta strand repeat-containing protein [Fodinibius halophilus]NGP87886.1 DUF4097 domain-containing protein [Fodinibius halophilus]
MAIYLFFVIPTYSFNGGVVDSITTTENGRPSTSKPYITKEFSISGAGALKAFTANGNIDVLPSSSIDQVTVELYVDRGFSFWSNANNLDNFRITILKRDNEIVASVERKKRDTGLFSGSISFSFKIYVPESMSSELKTLSGDISLAEVHGQQMVKTGGGHISVTDASGQFKGYTSAGNIEIKDSQGTIYAQSESGDIRIDRSSGEFRLRTKEGNILSERISGTMLGRVKNGDISARFIRVGKGINLETTAGDIDVEVPNRTGYQLMLRGSKIQFAESDEVDGQIETDHIKGRYGDSGPPIELRTYAGKIMLEIK